MDYVSSLLEHTKTFESPTSFWKWSAYATIGAVLRNNVWKQDGDGKLYPNIYVLLLAGSGERKDRPVKTCESMIKKIANTRCISGRTSIQALVDEIGYAESSKDGRVIEGGAAIFVAPELAAGIVSDPAAIDILTDIYDNKPEGYNIYLRGRSKTSLGSTTFTMLAASNEAMLKELFTIKSTQGGFLARTFVVKPNEQRPPNPLTDVIDMSTSKAKLVTHLQEIAKLKGCCILTIGAKLEYDDWYVGYRILCRNKPDPSGVMGRLQTGVFKVAMILAANDGKLEISKENIEEAIELCMGLLPNYNTFIMSTGKSELATAGALLIEAIKKGENGGGNRRSRKSILREHWADIDAPMLDACVQTLDQAGFIKIEMSQDNGHIYSLTEKCLEVMDNKEVR